MGMNEARDLFLVDCTLREGEQTPGLCFTVEEKLDLLAAISRAGVTIFDAGMPAASAEEREFFREAISIGLPSRIGASVRALASEIDLAINTGCDELFIIFPVSPVHLEKRLRISPAQLCDRIMTLVPMAVESGKTVNFVAEDASRTPPEDLTRYLRLGLEAGGHRFFLCDTVGVMLPEAIKQMVATARAAIMPDTPLGIHCHNDMGLAIANTLAAIQSGARWPTVTVNGIGERAGHASLAEVSVASSHLLGLSTGIKPRELAALSHLVEQATGIPVPIHQPIVGHNVFRHESGIHADGVLKSPRTYEILDPEEFGTTRSFVAGKHSGRAVIHHLLREAGFEPDEDQTDRILQRVQREKSTQDKSQNRELVERVHSFYREVLDLPENRFLALAKEEMDEQ